MKLNEVYSTTSLIFVSNFKEPIKEDAYKKLKDTWIITNESTYNKEGRALIKNLDDYKNVLSDFNTLKESFNLEFFKILDPLRVDEFFNKARFNKPFDDEPNTHISNILGFVAMLLKLDPNSFMLRNFLKEIVITNAKPLGDFIILNAKGKYYKALGFFLLDFLNMLSISFKLKD